MTIEERIKAIRYFKGQKSTIEDRYNKIPQNSIAPRRACQLEIGYYDKAIEALEEKLCVDANANQHNSNALNDVGQHTNALEGDLISRQAVNNLQRYRYNCGETSITCVSLTDVNELPPVTPQEPKTEKVIKMRDATPEERESIDKYIKSISKATIAQENFSLIQKSLSYGTATSIGMALAKLELLEKQGCKVEPQKIEKINCETTKCENCINHNDCDYEPYERGEV